MYIKWLNKRARQLHDRDLAQGRPYGIAGSRASYKAAIHAAVIATGLWDPYTGDRMKWELIGTWDTSNVPDNVYLDKGYYLMPTVDHVDPWADVLHLQVCTWRTNCCKGGLTPDEFVRVCRRVVERN